jgi:hypothetical protein
MKLLQSNIEKETDEWISKMRNILKNGENEVVIDESKLESF